MKVKGIKTTEIEIDIEVNKITLLSIVEYQKYKEKIPRISSWWWLRSPGSDSKFAAYVNYDGSVDYYGYYVSHSAVRPALIYNSESSNLKVGDTIILVGYKWTVISDKYILCDAIVGRTAFVGSTAFRKDYKALDANDYEKSDIKKWLEKWANEHGIEVTECS